MGAPGAAAPVTGGMISLNFDDADIFSVIQTVFGEVLRVNYVVDPRVKGRVTFRSVAPVAKDQVLPVMEVILRINGIGVVEDNGLYRVVPLSEVSREPSPISFGRDPAKIPVTGKSLIQVVPILYLQSPEMVKLITPFLSANAVVLDVPKSNQIIIVDTDASIRRILSLIDTFDNEQQKKKRAQPFVYAVQNGKATDITNILQQIFLGSRSTVTGTTTTRPATTTTPGTTTTTMTQTGQAQNLQTPPQPLQSSIQTGTGTTSISLVSELTRIFADEIRNSIVILATPEDYETIRETIEKIDIAPRQVVIEGVVAQVSLTDDLSLGLAYSLQLNLPLNKPGVLHGPASLNATTLDSVVTTLQSGISTKGAGFTFYGTDSSGVVRAYINALASESRAKLLAAPHILVSDNREARIQVGQQVPIVTSETFGSGTIAPQRTIQYKDIGIILKIKPQINESGLVTLDVSQEISTYEIKSLFGEDQVILDKTEATTNLVVRDGQTIIIGGLIREDATSSKSGLPFLSKIPVLGYLFRTTNTTTSRVELIILLTPHVIKNQGEAASATSKYIENITSSDTKGGLKRDELLKSGVQIREGTRPAQNTPDVVITIENPAP